MNVSPPVDIKHAMADNKRTVDLVTPPADHAVVVMEAAGYWAAALRSLLSDPPVRIVQTRSRPECLETVARLPGCLVVVEIARADIDRGLDLLAELDEHRGSVPAIVAADCECKNYQWLARQLGAVDFVTNTRSLRRVAPIARRHFAAQPPVARSDVERTLAKLPWGE